MVEASPWLAGPVASSPNTRPEDRQSVCSVGSSCSPSPEADLLTEDLAPPPLSSGPFPLLDSRLKQPSGAEPVSGTGSDAGGGRRLPAVPRGEVTPPPRCVSVYACVVRLI